MSEFRPYVPADESIAEFNVRSVLAGIFLGIIFGCANAYLGLRVGLTISTSIPAAVMSVALFRALAKVLGPATILEHNTAQTVGSASSSLASGVVFTIPALFMWGFDPGLFKVAMLAGLGGTLGILAMVPLRRYLIVAEHGTLPYPEGVAASQVLIASESGGARSKNVFVGLGLGGITKGLVAFGHLWPDQVSLKVPYLKKGILSIEPTAALIGVGYILGYRIGAIMVGGGLLASLGLIPLIAHFGEGLAAPLFPEAENLIRDMTAGQIWSRYVRYIGAGAVAFAGIVTAIRAMPTMFSALRAGMQGFRSSASQGREVEVPRTSRDLNMKVLVIGLAAVLAVIILSPVTLGTGTSILVRILGALSIAIFGFMFVTVSSRIVGLVGVTSNPTSAMAIVTLLATSILFYLLGWTDMAGQVTVITIGTVVCTAASIAGDTSQDLKTGFILGATPSKQQMSELIGVWSSAFFVAAAVWMLGEAFTFGSSDLPAPQATLMKTVVEGVLEANLPWGLVIAGAALSLVVMLLGIPALPFAVGVYLPAATMTPLFVGGCIRALVEWKARRDGDNPESRSEQGVLLGSGFIAGEGLMGVMVAIYAFMMSRKPSGFGIDLGEPFGSIIAMLIFSGLGFLLYASSRKSKAA